MSAKYEVPLLFALTAAFGAALYGLFATPLPFVPLFSALPLIILTLESLGKSPIAFVLGAITTVVAITFMGRFNGPDVTIVPSLLIIVWGAIFGLHQYRRHLEKTRWQNLLAKDEEAKEVKNLKYEITLYEQRQIELSQHTAQRRLLSRAAREIGALLDPQLIQNKLLEIAQLIFPGHQVEVSHGHHRDGLDTYVFQKRQPLVIPSEGFKGPPLMAVPISVQRSVVGVLRVGGDGLQEPKRAFGREDLRLLDVLASLASLAMDNCQLFQQVQQSALRDNLTGLLTQRAFQEKIDAAILEASRYGQSLSLILADVDHFKSVNDTYGHQMGDQILQGFAHIMDRNVRPVDIICRHGGEEFVILLLQTPHKGAMEIAERIRLDLAEQGFDSERGVFSVTASFGVATFPDDATSAQQLFRQADQRLYKAKNGGRNQTRGLA